jgi:hypothetical protein
LSTAVLYPQEPRIAMPHRRWKEQRLCPQCQEVVLVEMRFVALPSAPGEDVTMEAVGTDDAGHEFH